jgi:hypothetical protein
MTSTSPLGGTGPRVLPPIDLAAIRARFASLHSRILYLEKNRTPQAVRMSDIGNAASMQQAAHGHAAVYSQTQGAYVPSPVLAELLFHMPSDLSVATSDPLHARYSCNILAVSADLTTFASSVVFEVLVNGTSVASVTMTSASTGLVPVAGFPALVPYTDLVTVACTSPGAGNQGLVVHVELGVVVSGITAGP